MAGALTRRGGPAAGAATSLLLWPATVEAHLASTGLGPVYDGISHLLLSIDDVLPVVAMALLAGLNGPAAGRWASFVLPVAWLGGGLVGFRSGAASVPAGITSMSLLLFGTLVAADHKARLPLMAALAAVLGLLHGWLNGAGIAIDAREASGLVGIVGAVFVLTALVSAGVLSLRPPSARIVVRVAGSWIAATGLLLAGWSVSGRL